MSQQVDAAIDAVLAEIARVKNEAIADLKLALEDATPVDTGFAQSNWIASLNEPATEPGGAQAAEAGLAEVMACTDPNVDRFLTNPTPYMPFLAEGSSEQAPAGWIDATVERVNALVEQREAYREKVI